MFCSHTNVEKQWHPVKIKTPLREHCVRGPLNAIGRKQACEHNVRPCAGVWPSACTQVRSMFPFTLEVCLEKHEKRACRCGRVEYDSVRLRARRHRLSQSRLFFGGGFAPLLMSFSTSCLCTCRRGMTVYIFGNACTSLHQVHAQQSNSRLCLRLRKPRGPKSHFRLHRNWIICIYIFFFHVTSYLLHLTL